MLTYCRSYVNIESNLQITTMKTLTKKEILDQLKKLGIDSSSELKNYLEEYKEYYHPQNLHIFSQKESL